MNSIGGEWSDGMAIYDAISLSKCYVTIIVYGQAESMSSIILQAADEKIITPNSYFMIHYGSSDASGDYLNVQNLAKYEQAICDKMIIYIRKVVSVVNFLKISTAQMFRVLKSFYIENLNRVTSVGFSRICFLWLY